MLFEHRQIQDRVHAFGQYARQPRGGRRHGGRLFFVAKRIVACASVAVAPLVQGKARRGQVRCETIKNHLLMAANVHLLQQSRQFVDQFKMRGRIATGQPIDLETHGLAWPKVTAQASHPVPCAR